MQNQRVTTAFYAMAPLGRFSRIDFVQSFLNLFGDNYILKVFQTIVNVFSFDVLADSSKSSQALKLYYFETLNHRVS